MTLPKVTRTMNYAERYSTGNLTFDVKCIPSYRSIPGPSCSYRLSWPGDERGLLAQPPPPFPPQTCDKYMDHTTHTIPLSAHPAWRVLRMSAWQACLGSTRATGQSMHPRLEHLKRFKRSPPPPHHPTTQALPQGPEQLISLPAAEQG